MAEVISLGETQHETERLTIRRLREALPEDYTLLHSFWVLRDGQIAIHFAGMVQHPDGSLS